MGVIGMKQNNEIVTEVRDVLFHFMKEYTRIEDKHRVVNPFEISNITFEYLSDVKDLFKNFSTIVDDVYIMVMKSKGEEK